MKAKSYLLMGLLATAMVFVSCEEVVDESCDANDLTEELNCTENVVATFCTDGTNNSYYTYNGTKYECTGVEYATCEAALNSLALALAEKGCGSSKSGSIEVKLSSMAEQLLMEVRTKSLE